eukprot:5443752-Pyramimonas_sp.AAC.1
MQRTANSARIAGTPRQNQQAISLRACHRSCVSSPPSLRASNVPRHVPPRCALLRLPYQERH